MDGRTDLGFSHESAGRGGSTGTGKHTEGHRDRAREACGELGEVRVMNEAGIETLGMVYQGFKQGVGCEVSANIECVQESLWRRQKMPR